MEKTVEEKHLEESSDQKEACRRQYESDLNSLAQQKVQTKVESTLRQEKKMCSQANHGDINVQPSIGSEANAIPQKYSPPGTVLTIYPKTQGNQPTIFSPKIPKPRTNLLTNSSTKISFTSSPGLWHHQEEIHEIRKGLAQQSYHQNSSNLPIQQGQNFGIGTRIHNGQLFHQNTHPEYPFIPSHQVHNSTNYNLSQETKFGQPYLPTPSYRVGYEYCKSVNTKTFSQIHSNFPPTMMSPPTTNEASYTQEHRTGHYLGNKWISPNCKIEPNHTDNYWSRQFNEKTREPSPYFKGLGDSPNRESSKPDIANTAQDPLIDVKQNLEGTLEGQKKYGYLQNVGYQFSLF